jgi:hypothetical protein
MDPTVEEGCGPDGTSMEEERGTDVVEEEVTVVVTVTIVVMPVAILVMPVVTNC